VGLNVSDWHVIGIDAGGSATTAVLVDARGNEVAQAVAGGANLRSVGSTVVAQVLAAVLAPLLKQGPVRAVCIGAAGAGRDADSETVHDIAKNLIPSETELIIKHDGQIALRAATSKKPAMVVIAGTGSMAYGERADGTSVRGGGYGALIGDDGGAFVVGLAALRHTARALDGIDRTGPLADSVAHALGAKSANQIIERVHRWPPDVAMIAALATLVGEACDAGDAAAEDIAVVQARALAAIAGHVARSVRGDTAELPVALSGGAFDAVPLLYDAVGRAVERTGQCEVFRLKTRPAKGAALIALDALEQPK
jgi:N-acetylglucosamine kinase-like BadF-type ATPase